MTPPFSIEEQVAVVVLSYNNVEDTLDCIASILISSDVHPHIYLVDNGSEDNTIEIVQSKYTGVEIISEPQNTGFAHGNNVGITKAYTDGYKYIIVLNNDTICDRNMISELVSFAQTKPNCGMVMPRILVHSQQQFVKKQAMVWSDGGYFRKFPPTILLKDDRKKNGFIDPKRIEFAPGCCLLFPIKTLETVGLFDNGYFFFYEDWDYSLRVREAGFDIWCTPNATLWHKISRSTGKDMAKYWETRGESGLRFFRRHFSPLSSVLQMGYLLARDFGIRPMNWKFLKDYLRGIRAGKSRTLEDYPVLASLLDKNTGN
jgi:hypothetical protein